MDSLKSYQKSMKANKDMTEDDVEDHVSGNGTGSRGV
jgi:hypothetical protein